MDETLVTTECPAAAPLTRRRRRRWIALAACAVGAVALIALVFVCGWLHFHNTPDFATYVRKHHATGADEPIDSDARLLGTGGDWWLGKGDPFTAPLDASEGGTLDVRVRHGDDVLLVSKQSFAWTVEADGTTRANFALRTDELKTHEHFHAAVRIYVHDAERFLGPDSARAGALTFDILLLSGAGRSSVSLEDDRRGEWPALTGANDHGLATLVARFVPWSTVPHDGLVHHLRETVYLMAESHPGGGGSNGWGNVEHAVNTAEYSYEVEVRLAERDNSSAHTWTSGSKLSWNGRVW